MTQPYNIGGSSDYITVGQTPPVQKSKSRGCGCFGIVGAIVILVIIALAGYFFVYPALSPNKMRGNFLDMAIVPTKDGKQNLWILNDGSFRFIQTTKSPGSYSTGVKCYFCKTWTYIYDPKSETVLKKIKTEYKDIITKLDMLYDKGKVWVFTREYGENEPMLNVYDAETTEQIMDTKDFINKHPELSAGLTGLHYDDKEKTVNFQTKDGKQGIVYDIEEDKLYQDYASHNEAKRNAGSETYSICVLAGESSSGPRKKLYRITGPKDKIISNMSSLESYANNPHSMEFFVGATSQPLSEKVYLEGITYHKDEDCTIIIYLDQLGRKSNRILTCVDAKTGKEKWTIQQDDLFSKMKINEEKDSFSSLFFTKDNIKVKRSGDLVVLELAGEGLMGFDFETGKKLWTLDL